MTRNITKCLVIAMALLSCGCKQQSQVAKQLPASELVDAVDDLTIRQRKLPQQAIRVTQDQMVELVWLSDEDSKLHLHGYDIMFSVSPLAPTTINFVAHATGRFPVISHDLGGHGPGHEPLLYIEVYPK